MRKVAVIAAVSLLLGSVALGRGGVQREMPDEGIETGKVPDQAKEKACRCCEECMAAMKSTKGKEEGAPKTSGCRDCCERCGKVKQPIDKKFPPDVVK